LYGFIICFKVVCPGAEGQDKACLYWRQQGNNNCSTAFFKKYIENEKINIALVEF